MQIGKNLYVNLEVIGSRHKNLIKELDLVNIKVVETAGASLPYVFVSVLIKDNIARNFIQEGNTIKVTLGNTPGNADSFTFTIYKMSESANDPVGGTILDFAGFILNSSYMTDQRNEAYSGNSLMVVNEIMKKYFGKRAKSSIKGEHYTDTDFKKTSENQVVWRRKNQTACSFVTEVLLHSDLNPSFPLFSFDKYGNFLIKDLKKKMKKGPKYTFVQHTPKNSNEIEYKNEFSVENFKDMYNMYSGFNKITEIYGIDSGIPTGVVDMNDPILASTAISEQPNSGNIIQTNDLQSSNVHNTYKKSFAYNSSKLISLSSMLGALVTTGVYRKDLKPLDLVSVTIDNEVNDSLGGLYLIDSIVTEANPTSDGVTTYIYVTRDNKNNVENYVTDDKKKKRIKIRGDFFQALLDAIRAMNYAYSTAMQFVDGTFLNRILTFGVATKNNLLRSFSIAGVTQDFTGEIGILKTLILSGNSIMNTLVTMVFPESIATTLIDFIIRKPTLIGLISSYVAEFVPPAARYPIMYLMETLFRTTDTLNSIAKDNGLDINEQAGDNKVDDSPELDYTDDSQDRVNGIINDFQNNTTGLDIPFPIIGLTESQALLPDDDLRNYIAVKTIDNLTDLNYLEDVDKDDFKDILIGNKPIDFTIIEKINKNAGNSFAYRLWGSFSSLIELNSFTIKKSYKDKYRTLPCTKLVSALRGDNIFFACPSKEADVRFYVNSQRVILKSFEVDLGYVDLYKNPMPYTVYYTEDGYNSNSILFEVKQGGMV